MDLNKAKREIIGMALLLEEISDFVVFVDYSGHVNDLTIWVAKNKKEYTEKLFKGQFYTDKTDTKNIEQYQVIKDFLQSEIEKITVIK